MKHVLLFLCLFFASTVFAAGGASQTNTKIVTQTTITATTTSTLVLAANSYRQYLLIQNNGATDIIVKFTSVQSSTEGFVIPAGGGSYEMNKPATDAIYLRSASSTDSVRILEGN